MTSNPLARTLIGSLLCCCADAAHADDLVLAFTPDRTLESGAPDPYTQCYGNAGAARGTLEPGPAVGACHRGKLGIVVEGEFAAPAEFTSAPFPQPLDLAGPASVVTHFASEDGVGAGSPIWGARLEYELYEILPAGEAVLIATGTAIESFYWGRREGAFNVGRYRVAAGNRLRLLLASSNSTTSRGELLFGGGGVGDSGITLATGTDSRSRAEELVGGALPSGLLLPLLAAGLLRRRAAHRGASSVNTHARAIAAIVSACLAACGPSPDVAKAGRPAPADEAHLVRITGGNPFLDLPGCGPNTFFGSNFEGAEVEPMVAVSPANADDLVATWFQDASLTYVTAVSRDGGRNWQTVPVPGISACDGGTAQAGADSWLSIGPDATVYLSGFSVHLDALPVPLPTRTTMQVSRGTFAPDDGITWSAPSVVQAGAGVFHDRPVVTAHPTVPGRAYVLWNDGTQVPPAVVQPLMFATSGDGGLTWSTPTLVHLPPAGISHEGRIHVLADGALLATFMVNATHPFTHQLLSKRSENGGQTWQAVPTTIADIPAGAATPVNGDCRTLAAPIRDEDHGPRCAQMPEQEIFADVAPDGSVFATWAQHTGEDQSEIRVSRSTDGGRSWLAPVSVSAAPGEKAIPALAIDADGTVGVAWYDFRSDVAGDGVFSGEVWFAHSRDHGASWREERIAGPFDMNAAPHRLIPVEGLFLGDYFGLVAVAGGFGAVFALPAPYAVEGTTDLFFAKVRVSPGRNS